MKESYPGENIVKETIESERRALEGDASKKDTKPLYHLDVSDPSRPIMVVGGHGMWYEDMKDMTERLREKVREPSELRNVKSDVSNAVEQKKRSLKGTRSFYFSKNPLAKEK